MMQTRINYIIDKQQKSKTLKTEIKKKKKTKGTQTKPNKKISVNHHRDQCLGLFPTYEVKNHSSS